MFVDSPAKVVRYIVDYGGDLMETIYDYNLGISYSFASSQCTKSSMVDGDVGVINGKFNVKELLWQRGDFLYLGKFFYVSNLIVKLIVDSNCVWMFVFTETSIWYNL